MKTTLVARMFTRGSNGWQLVKTAPVDARSWTQAERSWIDTHLQIGGEYLKVGNTMYDTVRADSN